MTVHSPASPVEQIRFGDASIAFSLLKGSRRRKRLAIRVTREGQVEVLMPARTSRQEALRAVALRGDWILHHVRKAQARPQAVPLHYWHGETHWLLGKQIILDVARPEDIPGEKKHRLPRVQLSENRLLVRLPVPTPETVRKAVLNWYRSEAQKILAEHLTALCACIPWLLALPPWQVKRMRRRWGSCTLRGELTLNTHLVKAPPRCIDYVLLHEIAHLREHNHSRNFYTVLEQLLPEWKTLRQELEYLAPLLLNT